MLFTPSGNAVQWVLLQVCVAQGFVLLTLPGGSVLSSTAMVQLGHEENRLDLYLGSTVSVLKASQNVGAAVMQKLLDYVIYCSEGC